MTAEKNVVRFVGSLDTLNPLVHPFAFVRSIAETSQLNLLDRQLAIKLGEWIERVRLTNCADELDELKEKRDLFWIPRKQDVRPEDSEGTLEGNDLSSVFMFLLMSCFFCSVHFSLGQCFHVGRLWSLVSFYIVLVSPL